jgi:hypothetical protein
MRLIYQRHDVLAKMMEHAVRKNDYSVGSGKNGWAQRVQDRGVLGLDPADIPQAHPPPGSLLKLGLSERRCSVVTAIPANPSKSSKNEPQNRGAAKVLPEKAASTAPAHAFNYPAPEGG